MKVSSNSSQRQQVQRPQERSQAQPQERSAQVNRQARDYARLSPDQKRSSAVTRKPAPKIQRLGGKIDVRA